MRAALHRSFAAAAYLASAGTAAAAYLASAGAVAACGDDSSSPSRGPRRPAAPSVVAIDATHYTISSGLVARVKAAPRMIAREVEIVQAATADGFELRAIRPGSTIAQLGFEDGDVIHAVNGDDLSTTRAAMGAYLDVADARHFDVAITRRGRDLVLHFTVK